MRGKNYFKNVVRQKNYGSRKVVLLDEGNGTEVDVLHNTFCDKPFKKVISSLIVSNISSQRRGCEISKCIPLVDRHH